LFPSEWAVREYSPDYGIDLDVELFEKQKNGVNITKGEHVLFQVKGQEVLERKKIQLYSRYNVEKAYQEDKSKYFEMEVIQYPLDTDLLSTVERMGSAVPVLLTVVDVKKKEAFFVCLNDYIEKVLILYNHDYYLQNKVTINIPTHNCVNNEFGQHIIEWYGKRAKLYSFFNKVHYQNNELNYVYGRDYVEQTDYFLKIICRLDVWSAANYFPALKDIKDEIDYYIEHKNTKMGEMCLKGMIEAGEDVDCKCWETSYEINDEVSFRESNLWTHLKLLWDKMCNTSNIFEEIAKEAYLPSWLAEAVSYDCFDDKCVDG
jgi:hypothetical protein